MNIRTKTAALAIVAAILQGAFAHPAFSGTDLKGEAVEAPDGARVIEIDPATRWVNVQRNRTVVFVANGHRFMPPAGKVQFIASTNKPFDALMADAMAVMQDGMDKAPMNHDPNHDFVTMMIPHHQGAVDMAKALLLYSNDQELRTMAQEIIAEQQVEIQFMRAWLARHAAK